MRYGKPSMKQAYDELMAANPGLKEVVLVPLYPHYAMSSYETAVVHAREVYNQGGYPFSIRFVEPFYSDPLYIAALAESIRPSLRPGSHLLFSYHSIPEQHIHKGDITGNHCLKSGNCCTTPSEAHKFCYRHQCLETTRLVAAYLGISEADHSVSFQSKLGRAEWLKPSTTSTLTSMPARGIKNVSVVCPAFVSDCLETLEEVAIQEKENFHAAGGETYTFIPCMNIQPQWVSALSAWLQTA
jgi:ferrochelatase